MEHVVDILRWRHLTGAYIVSEQLDDIAMPMYRIIRGGTGVRVHLYRAVNAWEEVTTVSISEAKRLCQEHYTMMGNDRVLFEGFRDALLQVYLFDYKVPSALQDRVDSYARVLRDRYDVDGRRLYVSRICRELFLTENALATGRDAFVLPRFVEWVETHVLRPQEA